MIHSIIQFSDKPCEENPEAILFCGSMQKPYTVTVYPRFFELSDEDQVTVWLHELDHLRILQEARPTCDNCGNSGASCIRCGTK